MTFSSPGRWPDQPVIEEINTWVWLSELGAARGRNVGLGDVRDEDWDAVLLPGVDAVWLMGVWSRSPAGAVIARTEAGVRGELEAALPGLTDDDVVGSPYSIRAYSVDRRLGGDEGLAAARAQLASRGVRLIVDYVPNHVARDHSWATSRPEYLVRGTPADLEREPTHFIPIGESVVALGRDPYFPPWTDVVQLNAFAPELRAATTDTLCTIAQQADGVRCDMAMLLLNHVFAGTWGSLVGEPPAAEFWPDIIAAAKTASPNFLFVAEAYWDLEPRLLEQGFDYCYDKRLYDRVIGRDAGAIRAHLTADSSYQRRMVRFLENHDEPRSATSVPPAYRDAAAVAVTTLPGALLLYEGQAEGRTQRPPVQLGRRPHEPADEHRVGFYQALLSWLHDCAVRDGEWQLLDVTSLNGDTGAGNLVAWSWSGSERFVVVVNLSDHEGSGRVQLPWSDLAGHDLTFAEQLASQRYDHAGDEVAAQGLYVNLAPGAFHALRLE